MRTFHAYDAEQTASRRLTTIFFGFYLYGLDVGLSLLFTKVLGAR